LTKRDEPDELAVPFFDDGKNVFFIDLAHGDRYYKSHSAWKHQQNEITSQHPAAVVSLFFLATSLATAERETKPTEKNSVYTPPCTNLWRQKRGNVSSNSVTINQKTPVHVRCSS
jgi:hypothetical protein